MSKESLTESKRYAYNISSGAVMCYILVAVFIFPTEPRLGAPLLFRRRQWNHYVQ